MTFESILFLNPSDRVREDQAVTPDCFRDLNLEQIVAAVTAGKEEYNLTPFFHMPLHDVEAVAFRHEVLHDLETKDVLDALKAFAQSMHLMREHLTQLEGRFYERQKERWFVDAVDLYCEGVRRLTRDLTSASLASRGLVAFRDYIAGYASSEAFLALAAKAKLLQEQLSAIRYNIYIKGAHVEVHPHAGEEDYSLDVQATFERFQQGKAGAYDFKFSDDLEMNHIEARILDGVAHLHADTLSDLSAYRAANAAFRDATITAFDREIEFYIAYLDHAAKIKKAGLSFCFPQVSVSSKTFLAKEAFDLALAGKLAGEGAAPVTNDFYLENHERIIVVSGPNQGGKTTTARTFGQLHYIGSLGLPVPGAQARLYLPDNIFTHFEREEHTANLRGKLQDDLIRIYDILQVATPRSIIIINEIFASTTLRDAIFLSRKIGDRIVELDVLCVWVSFIDEVASLSPWTVSMVAEVVPEDPTQRTFRVVRRPADGLAHAMALARKYGLTYDMVRERVGS